MDPPLVWKIPHFFKIYFEPLPQEGNTLPQAAICGADLRSVKILSAQKKCLCWNIPDKDGDTPIMKALKTNKLEIVKVLIGVPWVDLTLRDREGWSLVFRAIQNKQLGQYLKYLNISVLYLTHKYK